MAFRLEETSNPPLRVNEIFPAVESFGHPRMVELLEKYQLESVVAGVQGEWDRIRALRHWIFSRIEVENDNPTPCREDALAILDATSRGGRFHCAHFSLVLHAVLNSFGYITRRLQCGPGQPGDDGNHGVNEVWVNELCKWVLVDAKYDLHFEKEDVPLSALEIRDEVLSTAPQKFLTRGAAHSGPDRGARAGGYSQQSLTACATKSRDRRRKHRVRDFCGAVLSDGGQAVVLKRGPDRQVHPSGIPKEKLGGRAATYRWCAWETNTNHFTAAPSAFSSALVVYADPYFTANTWLRDGKPHWAYGTPYFLPVTRREFIEWTPNVVGAKVEIEGDTASIQLRSCTPNFMTYQQQADGERWVDCTDVVSAKLCRGNNAFAFRSLNRFGVSGPIHRVQITG
jgi:hypothetical protein